MTNNVSGDRNKERVVNNNKSIVTMINDVLGDTNNQRGDRNKERVVNNNKSIVTMTNYVSGDTKNQRGDTKKGVTQTRKGLSATIKV